MDDTQKKKDIAMREEATLDYWRENGIFEKSLAKNKGKENFVFYDGPPFATGLPHYGHVLPGTIKDVIPRYQSMRGKFVRRKWGWDCHGLPIENLVEEELGLLEKKDIEAFGVGKFNEAARKSVLRYDTEWKEIVPRMGRWVDMEDAYRTMDWQYTESIWWAFRELFQKGLIYEGYKSMHICPRCETTLAISEVTQGYKDITDISITVKFPLEDEPGTSFLAWTTTPWTLPGNVALAVNPDVPYVRVKVGDEQYILAKSRIVDAVQGEYEIVEEMKGQDLVGKKYKPVFDYYAKNGGLENRGNGWKVYAADFVDTESGTGIVHIAPAFGEDDMALGQAYNLPFVQHVGMNGRFKDEVADFAGRFVKPKENPEEADVAIIKNLAHRGLLFAKEKISHSYPHCWRCDTPLLNYAASSWFVKVTALKDRLSALNAHIRWVPEHVGTARFGNWLAEARDWAISRSRFWGAPIPVWKCAECDKLSVIGSVEDIRERADSKNEYYVLRHGEAESNARNIVSARADAPHHLTEKGKEEARQAATELAGGNIDFIFVSPFVRTTETADIVAETLGITGARIISDERLREIDTGDFDGRPIAEYRHYFSSQEEKFTKPAPNGETLTDMKNRLGDFLYDIDARYEGKKILIVTHEYGVWLLSAAALGAGVTEAVRMKDERGADFVKTGELLEIDFTPLPHNGNYELDLHRPYIDDVVLSCECGGHAHRVPEVFDCWFESGSMPYAQFHYPFENEVLFRKSFPADFIAEGLDQTRGWFYTMLVLAAGLFDETAYRNVVVNGLVLAEDGQKMSKRLKNYPDPLYIVNTYGADALRYYLMSSPAVRAEPLYFSEKGVDEVYKKVLGRLFNVLSFYELYAEDKKDIQEVESEHVLDRWILARLSFLGNTMAVALDVYMIDKATREIGLFVDDLSTWYIRRSRERFKADSGGAAARSVTRYVLQEFSKLIAPVMPFAAEDIYQRVCHAKESVHLEDWPTYDAPNTVCLETMNKAREVVSFALLERANAGIKARQPLQKLTVTMQEALQPEYAEIIRDEVNVKDVIFEKGQALSVKLDTVITPELKREGQARELIRRIQELRKKKGMLPADTISVLFESNEAGRGVIEEFDADIRRISNAKTVSFGAVPDGEDISFDELLLKVRFE